MSKGWRRILNRSVPIAVSLGTLAWVFSSVDVSAVAAAVTPRVAWIMVPALLAFAVVSLWIESVSIRCLLPPDTPLDGWSAARIKCASYLPGIIHYTIGVGGLALMLKRRTRLGLSQAASLVLLIASADLCVVLTTAAGGAALTEIGSAGVRLGVAAVVIGGFVLGLTFLRAPGDWGALESLRQHRFFDGLRQVPLPRLAQLLVLRTCFAACFVAGCASAFYAFDIPAPPAQLVGGVMVVALVAALPIAVSGLGTTQAAFVVLFSNVAPAERILAMSLVLSFGIISVRGAMGLLFAGELTREALEDARAAEA